MTDLTPTGRVILGMIRMGKRTGYDIKQLVEVSTRFFWTASYGQIYPELKRLEAAGLVTGEPDPAGGRARTVYALTPAGEEALDAWLDSREALVWELRDEALLKLFLSGDREHGALRELAQEAQRRGAEAAERLGAINPDLDADPEPGPMMTLRFGIELTQWMSDWWARVEERVGPAEDQRRR